MAYNDEEARKRYEWSLANPAAAQEEFRAAQQRVRAALPAAQARGTINATLNADGGEQSFTFRGTDLKSAPAQQALGRARMAFERMQAQQQPQPVQPKPAQPQGMTRDGMPVTATYAAGSMAGLPTADYHAMVNDFMRRGSTYNDATAAAKRVYLQTQAYQQQHGFAVQGVDPGAPTQPEINRRNRAYDRADASGRAAIETRALDEKALSDAARAQAAMGANVPQAQPMPAQPVSPPGESIGSYHIDVGPGKATDPNARAEAQGLLTKAQAALDTALQGAGTPEEVALYRSVMDGTYKPTMTPELTEFTGQQAVAERQRAQKAMQKRMANYDESALAAASVAGTPFVAKPKAKTDGGEYAYLQSGVRAIKEAMGDDYKERSMAVREAAQKLREAEAADRKQFRGDEVMRKKSSEYRATMFKMSGELVKPIDEKIKAVDGAYKDAAKSLDSVVKRMDELRKVADDSTRDDSVRNSAKAEMVLMQQEAAKFTEWKNRYGAEIAKNKADKAAALERMTKISTLPVPSRLKGGASAYQVAALMQGLPMPEGKDAKLSEEQAAKWLEVYDREEVEAAAKAAGWSF